MNRRVIPQVKDKELFLYVDKAIIEQDDSSICIIQGKEKTPVPVAKIAALILGPGTSITHRAISAMAAVGCTVCWTGENFRTFYAYASSEDVSSARTLAQAKAWANPETHLQVAKAMYYRRFPDASVDTLNLQQLRGAEGRRIKKVYENYAKQYGVVWGGRAYDDNWDEQTRINQLLTVTNKILYHICHAVILALGYSPALGFVHTGTQCSFVYDIADLYKADITIPLSFQLATMEPEDGDYLALARQTMREALVSKNIVKSIITDLNALIPTDTPVPNGTLFLWNDDDSLVPGSLNYGR